MADALEAFDGALSRSYITPQLRLLAGYYRGRTHAELGNPAQAIEELSAVAAAEEADSDLRAAAKRAAWRIRSFGSYPFRQRQLMVMMQQSDMLSY